MPTIVRTQKHYSATAGQPLYQTGEKVDILNMGESHFVTKEGIFDTSFPTLPSRLPLYRQYLSIGHESVILHCLFLIPSWILRFAS